MPAPPNRLTPSGPLQGVCNGPEECRLAVRQQMKYGADVIKICASGGVLSESDPVDVPQLTPAELTAIMSEAHAWNRKVAAHSHGDLAAKQAVEAGVDSIEHGSFLQPATLQLMKQKGVYLVPTRMTQVWVDKKADTYPPKIAAKARAAAAAHTQMFKNALKIGVPIAFGTDAAVYPHGMNAEEFGDMVDLGMTPSAALLSQQPGLGQAARHRRGNRHARNRQVRRHRRRPGRRAAEHPRDRETIAGHETGRHRPRRRITAFLLPAQRGEDARRAEEGHS